MNVRVRGIYATALTEQFRDVGRVVQASPPIRDRFDEDFPVAPADVAATTTDDRQGVTLAGDHDAVDRARDRLRDFSRDTLAWDDPAPQGAVFRGTVADTLGSGAVVDLGAGAEGFLPYENSPDYLDGDETVLVQVRDPVPPWGTARPVLDTAVRIETGLVTLVRGGASDAAGTAARLEDLLPVDPPDGWAVRWGRDEDDAPMGALADALEVAGERAATVDAGLGGTDVDERGPGDHSPDGPGPNDALDPNGAPGRLAAPAGTAHVWFGREGRFALDEVRRRVAPTMHGHHRVKAGTGDASAAVDFVEAVCDPDPDAGFPFDAVTRQFGPVEGDAIAIAHGKPDGRLITLGTGEVSARDLEGGVTVRREMHPGGTYDALGVERRAGDVAVTKFREGRWWYATAYRGQGGARRGTYVNVCTPVEVFPDAVRYVDLHVDVVKLPDGTVRRVDDDELDAAVAAGTVGSALAEKARDVASKVEAAL